VALRDAKFKISIGGYEAADEMPADRNWHENNAMETMIPCEHVISILRVSSCGMVEMNKASVA
jgi:hypothetical protein